MKEGGRKERREVGGEEEREGGREGEGLMEMRLVGQTQVRVQSTKDAALFSG
jgi:hypothetical protein